MKRSIRAAGLFSIGHSTDGITLESTVSDGPANTVYRDVSVEIPAGSVAFLLSALATDGRFSGAFRAIADELDRRAAIVARTDVSPVEHMANLPHSIGTANETMRLAREAFRPRFEVRRDDARRTYYVADLVSGSVVRSGLDQADAESLAGTFNGK